MPRTAIAEVVLMETFSVELVNVRSPASMHRGLLVFSSPDETVMWPPLRRKRARAARSRPPPKSIAPSPATSSQVSFAALHSALYGPTTRPTSPPTASNVMPFVETMGA